MRRSSSIRTPTRIAWSRRKFWDASTGWSSLLWRCTRTWRSAAGAIADGIGGALLFLMALSGMVLWWPGVRAWKRALRINWRARWAGLNFDLHRTFGFWCFLLVAMWGITGAYFIFPDARFRASSAPFPT